MRLKHLMGASLAGALLLTTSAFAQDAASKKFLSEAIQGNLAEVEMGKLAQQNGGSEKIKSFGQMLEKDHSAALEKARSAAQTAGVKPPSAPSAKQKSDHDKMAKLKGADFDREFATHMVVDHKKDIAAYEKEAKKNDAIGNYAKEALPTLKKHLTTAQGLPTKPTTTGSR